MAQSNKLSFQLTRETAGDYKCLAQNSVGKIEKIIKVGFYGKYGPEINR